MTRLPALLATLALAGCERAAPHADADADGRPAGPTVDAHGHAHDDHDHADEHGHDHAHDHAGHGDEVRLSADAARTHGVRLAVAQVQTIAPTLTLPGVLAYDAERMAHVGAPVAGRVTKLDARLGSTVDAGATLLTIDSPELGGAQSEYLQRRVAAQSARPAVELAQSAYDRAEALYATGGISLTDTQARQRELRSAQAERAAADAALAAARGRLQLLGMSADAVAALEQTGTLLPTYVVRAPLAGQIVERETTLGELVGPETHKLMVVADLSTVWAVADVPEARAGEVAVGARVTVNVGGAAHEGIVAHVAPALDERTRTARVRVALPNADGTLRPGASAQLDVAVSAGDESAVVVPAAAIFDHEGDSVVFVPVPNEPDTYAPRPLGLGDATAAGVPVYAGLKAGDRYVVDGGFILKAELGKAGAAHVH